MDDMVASTAKSRCSVGRGLRCSAHTVLHHLAVIKCRTPASSYVCHRTIPAYAKSFPMSHICMDDVGSSIAKSRCSVGRG